MIDPRELRIGNFVKPIRPRFNEDYLIIESVLLESVNHKFREYNINEIEPIPITEEWLIKLGFEILDKFEKRYILDTGGDRYWIKKDENSDFWRLIIYNYSEEIELNAIQYVHNLQNIIFALTGEELKYQL